MHASHQWLPVRDATTLGRMAMKAKDFFWPTMLEYDGSTVGRSTMSEASVAKMTRHHLGRDRPEHDVQRLARFLRATLLEHVDGTRQAIDDVRICRSPLESRAG